MQLWGGSYDRFTLSENVQCVWTEKETQHFLQVTEEKTRTTNLWNSFSKMFCAFVQREVSQAEVFRELQFFCFTPFNENTCKTQTLLKKKSVIKREEMICSNPNLWNVSCAAAAIPVPITSVTPPPSPLIFWNFSQLFRGVHLEPEINQLLYLEKLSCWLWCSVCLFCLLFLFLFFQIAAALVLSLQVVMLNWGSVTGVSQTGA